MIVNFSVGRPEVEHCLVEQVPASPQHVLSFLVVKVPQKTLLMDALKEETEIVYDFCMCNPPFFANQLEAKVRVSPPFNLPFKIQDGSILLSAH